MEEHQEHQEHQEPPKLYRSRNDRYISGVCGGLASYAKLDSNIVRVIFAISAFVGGIGLILYIAALILVPENPQEEPLEKKPASDNTTLWGVVFVAIGVLLLFWELDWFDLLYIDLPWTTLWALFLIGIGAALLYRQWQHDQEAQELAPLDAAGETPEKERRSSAFDIYRSRSDRKLAGVCGGLAKHYNVDPTLVRLGWVVVTIASKGLAGLIYLALIFILPEEASGQTAS